MTAGILICIIEALSAGTQRHKIGRTAVLRLTGTCQDMVAQRILVVIHHRAVHSIRENLPGEADHVVAGTTFRCLIRKIIAGGSCTMEHLGLADTANAVGVAAGHDIPEVRADLPVLLSSIDNKIIHSADNLRDMLIGVHILSVSQFSSIG